MGKLAKFLLILDIFVVLILFGGLLADKQMLSNNVLRLHVVANSDSADDQKIKLQVRDAVLSVLEPALASVTDKKYAECYIENHLREITDAANSALKAAGTDDRATVTLCREEFPVREYETFSLPSGLYDSLRITIGNGEGKNWWCVVFPSLCISAASKDTSDVAVSAGFSDTLTGAITGDKEYEFSFFFLDCLGRLENFFHVG